MQDRSHLDKKYFIDPHVYNCPYCNRRNVKYSLYSTYTFDWSNDKTCFVYYVRCQDCDKTSMHLSFSEARENTNNAQFQDEIDIDSYIFYSVPTSFFIIDKRIPNIIRELVSEAEGCVKMNFLTGASACTRKAIYELTIKEKAQGDDYESRIKFLKKKYTNIDSDLFDILCHIKDITSDKVHEQSWDKWDAKHLTLFIETLKVILHEIYVLPDEKKKTSVSIKTLLKDIKGTNASQENESRDGG